MTFRRGRAIGIVAAGLAVVLSGCGSGSALKAAGGGGTAAGGALPSAAGGFGGGTVGGSGGGSGPALKVVNDKGRFVDMALDPSTGAGVDIDIYLGTTQLGLAVTPKAGDSVTSLNPKPTKWVSNLAFGSATQYIPVPELSFAYVTKAGSTTLLNFQGDGSGDEVFAGDGMSSDDPGYASKALADTYVVEGGTDSEHKVLQIAQKHEADDPEESDGGDLPIAGKVVLLASMAGTPSVDASADPGAPERQLGLQGAGSCLPEEHGEDLGRHDSYMNVGVDTPVEYVADPGQLTLGVWATGDDAVCTGSPTATLSTSVQAGDRYYVFGYGPALSPKLLLLSIPAPTSGKMASPTPDQGD